MLSAQELWDEYHASNEYTITFDYDGTYDDITLVNADLDGGDSHPIAGTASFALGFVDTEQDESFTVTIALTFSVAKIIDWCVYG